MKPAPNDTRSAGQPPSSWTSNLEASVPIPNAPTAKRTNLAGGIGSALLRRLIRKKSSTLIYWGLALSAITFVSFTFCDSIWLLMPTQISLAVAWALIYVGSIKFIMKHNKERATATGFLNSILQMSAILGSLIGGFVIDWTDDLLAPMWLAAIMSLVSLIMYYGLRRHQGLGIREKQKYSV